MDEAPDDATPPGPVVTIHEAELAAGPSGEVLYGIEIDFAAAVTRRVAGLDVVVRGEDIAVNRRLAGQIEAAVGSCVRSDPHRSAGPRALPHFQPTQRPPEGHTFYETPRRRARKRP